MDDEKELEMLSAFVHGALAFGHFLGILYNFRRRNWKAVLVHSIALSFDLYCALIHYKESRK